MRTTRIARWEISRSAGTVDRTTAIVLAVMLLAVGTVGYTVIDDGPGLDDGIYVIGVDEDSPYHDVAEASDRFRPLSLEDVEFDERGADANVDVVITADGEIGYVGENGKPAYDAFRDAVESYNEQLMAHEADEAAAYPVLVTLEYQERTPANDPEGAGTTDDDGAADGSTGGKDGDGESATDAADGNGEPAGGGADGGGEDGELQVPNVGGGSLDDGSGPGSPSSLSPPFPFRSLVLAFLFVVPMNVVIQAYGSTIMNERIKRRGELLLVSPASRHEIVAGKTLPYLFGLVGVVVGTAVAIDGGPLSVAAAVPIALLFLAATFAGAMLARSFKELTFVTVTISVFLTTYTFIPAIFTEVNPVALISPLTLVVMDLQGESVRFGEYLFSTGPFYLSAAVLFLFGVGLYREEDMFAQKPLPTKVIDAVASRLHGTRSVPLLSMLFIPFVFAGQLLAVALLFAVPEAIALPIIVVIAAAIEEFAKSIHVYAGIARSRFDSSLRAAAVLGILSGIGFFVGEKLTHVVQFVGLPDLTLGAAAFGPRLSGDPLVVLAVVLAPLCLHVGTASISAVGASRGRTTYALAFVVATLVHAGYNLGVIALVA
nr:PrsW family intramembrane metalloprotease [Halopiger djelfimassiliensis]